MIPLQELIQLVLRFLSFDAVAFLDFSSQDFGVAGRYGEVVFGKFSPPGLHGSFELLPIALNRIFIHGV
jgi:hypothetical protein